MASPNPERRSERARRAILAAAVELCHDPGYMAASVEAIARRAGVGKQTIYRWWPSKGAVVLEAMNEHAGETLVFPDTGDIVADLKTQMTALAKVLAGPDAIGFAGLVAAAQSDPALADAVLETIVEPRIAACRGRLAAAQKQGQLRTDVNLDDVIELLYGPLYHRLLLRNQPITHQQPGDILDLAFGGLTPRDRAGPGEPHRAQPGTS